VAEIERPYRDAEITQRAAEQRTILGLQSSAQSGQRRDVGQWKRSHPDHISRSERLGDMLRDKESRLLGGQRS